LSMSFLSLHGEANRARLWQHGGNTNDAIERNGGQGQDMLFWQKHKDFMMIEEKAARVYNRAKSIGNWLNAS
jgi:hypothetical protein